METTKKRLDSVDVAKFVLSIMIVTIHLSPFPSLDPYIMPMLRVAVPLFFLISAFFFFGKYHAEITIEERSDAWKGMLRETFNSIFSG